MLTVCWSSVPSLTHNITANHHTLLGKDNRHKFLVGTMDPELKKQ